MSSLVILIHGFCRGAENMQFWKKALSPAFDHILTPDLPARYGSFESCVEKLTAEIRAASPEKYDQLLLAGHSMGGLMARAYLQNEKPANARKLVCAGTPHYGSKLADIALLLPGAGARWQPLRALKTSARKEVTTPDIPGLEIGAIVSTNNAHWPGKLFLSSSSDGLVESFSAIPPDAKCVAYTTAPHDPMQYDRTTAALIKKFFQQGTF